jgi:hypothetical protein
MKIHIGLVMFAVIAASAIAGCSSGGPSATGGGPAAPDAATGHAALASDAPPDGATSPATAFSQLMAQWNGSSFSFHGKRLTFKAVYTGVQLDIGVETGGADCAGPAQNVTVEQNRDDSLVAWPGCEEEISTPSDTYMCQLTSPARCAVGNYPDPLASFVEENFSASTLLTSFESVAPQFLTSAETAYSNTTFAGQLSKCVSYGPTPSTSNTICVTGDGLLAFLGGATAFAPGGVSSRMSLISYSSLAPTRDFDPPSGASLIPYAGPSPTTGTG